jgi:spermidine synthase
VDLLDRVAGIYIAAVAFLTGASVMIVELAASRVLSPYFGNTLYTWTALIGVIMIALSTGYYAGGRLADQRPNPLVLLHLVSAAAAFVLLVPALALKVTTQLAPEGQPVDMLWGPVSAALLLFAIPGCLLGTVSPFAIKLLSLRTENTRVGTSAGTIGMVSTCGSVVGTFGAGFVLIPSLGIRTIFVVVGVTLAGVAALGYAGLLGTRLRSLPAATLVLLGGMLLSFVAESSEAPREPYVVFQKDTYYHQIRVERRQAYGGRRITTVFMDRAPEGAQSDSDGDLVFAYTRYYELEKIFCPTMEKAAFLGGGAYAMPQALVDDHPEAQADVVEIDPAVEAVARRFFRLDEYEGRVNPVVGDARAFLAGTDERYNLIFGDAYRGKQNVPSHMVTKEFFQLLRQRLTDDGVYMMNLIGSIEGPTSQFFTSVAATLLEVFPELYVFAMSPSFTEMAQNLILVAPVQARQWDGEQLLHRAEANRQLETLVETWLPPNRYDLSQATVLTDDYNPVEYIIAQQLSASGAL